MKKVLSFFYLKFYLLSRKVNGRDGFNNYYTCLTLSFFEAVVAVCVVLLAEIFIGGVLSEGLFDKSDLLPISVMLLLFIVNYAYFTVGGRFRKVIGREESLATNGSGYVPGLIYLLSSMFVLFILAAVLFFK